MFGHLGAVAVNEVTTKMEGSGEVTMKDLKAKDRKKVEAGKRLTEYNCRKREELVKAQKSEPKLTSSQYYGTGIIVAIRHSWLFHLLIQERRHDSSSPT